jgi:hypothetical protein
VKSRDFCYWLQGFIELNEAANKSGEAPNPRQWELVKAHLTLVFKHEIDPEAGCVDKQKELNDIHSGKPASPLIDPTALVRC